MHINCRGVSDKMKQFKIKYFSLIEVIASMAIFTVLMLIMMNFFGKTQGLMTKRSSQAAQYADAQAALDLIGGQLQNYCDFEYVKSKGSKLATLQIKNSGSNKFLSYYTKEIEKYEDNGKKVITNLKLVGLWFDLEKNKLLYREKLLEPKDLKNINNEPILNFPINAEDIGNNTGKFADKWEEVISNIVDCKIEYFDSTSTSAKIGSMIYPAINSGDPVVELPRMIKITITTVNDDDVEKYKTLASLESTASIKGEDIDEVKKIFTEKDFDINNLNASRKVLANNIRQFTKTIYLGYRK